MKPVFQTRIGKPDGNCFAASVASILELPLDQVDPYLHGANDWLAKFERFLEKRGLWPLMLELDKLPADYEIPAGYNLLSGPAKRGLRHCVVGYGSKLAHDPYRGGNGILKNEDVILLIPRNPAWVKP